MATTHAPRTYRPPMGPGWFLRNRRYLLFMLRELTGVIMAVYLFILLWVLLQGRLGGRAGYENALPILRSSWFILFSFVALFFSLFHTFSWFGLTGWVGFPAPGGRGILAGPKVVVANVLGWLFLVLLAWYLLFDPPVRDLLPGLPIPFLAALASTAEPPARTKVSRAAPILWLGFTIGGFISAFFMPFLIVVVLLATLSPLPPYLPDFLAWEGMQSWLANPLARLFVAVVFIATIFHAFHRFKYVLYDYGGQDHPTAAAAITYGIVAIAALVTLYVVAPL